MHQVKILKFHFKRWAATSIAIWRFKKFVINYDEIHKDRYLVMVKIIENLKDEEILKEI
jgi:hypothetical protein